MSFEFGSKVTSAMTHAPACKRQEVANGEEVPRPKHPDIDGGWGWWVVFASFCIHIVSEYLGLSVELKL